MQEATWIDTHCHLDFLEEDLAAVVARARRAGVAGMVTVGTDLDTSRRSAELARMHEGVWACVGIHPHEASGFSGRAAQMLEDLASGPKVVGMGETGLDYYRDLSPRELQREAFLRQIELAERLDMALVVHMRDAHDDVFELLAVAGPPRRLVFHCFSGGAREAERAVELGGHLSFAGNISFPKSEELVSAARACPPERLLVETDSPFLAPAPHRGRGNEPAYLPAVGAALAEALGRPAGEVAELTRQNALRIFRLEGIRGE